MCFNLTRTSGTSDVDISPPTPWVPRAPQPCVIERLEFRQPLPVPLPTPSSLCSGAAGQRLCVRRVETEPLTCDRELQILPPVYQARTLPSLGSVPAFVK